MDELIARIEAASGPCVGLDADIELATGNWSEHGYEAWQRWQECGEAANPPMSAPVPPNRFTGSIDAALTLTYGDLYRCWAAGWTVDGRAFGSVGFDRPAYAAAPALALCAAALRARAA